MLLTRHWRAGTPALPLWGKYLGIKKVISEDNAGFIKKTVSFQNCKNSVVLMNRQTSAIVIIIVALVLLAQPGYTQYPDWNRYIENPADVRREPGADPCSPCAFLRHQYRITRFSRTIQLVSLVERHMEFQTVSESHLKFRRSSSLIHSRRSGTPSRCRQSGNGRALTIACTVTFPWSSHPMPPRLSLTA